MCAIYLRMLTSNHDIFLFFRLAFAEIVLIVQRIHRTHFSTFFLQLYYLSSLSHIKFLTKIDKLQSACARYLDTHLQLEYYTLINDPLKEVRIPTHFNFDINCGSRIRKKIKHFLP